MQKFYSPDGNIEVWDVKPYGFFTEDEWKTNHPELFSLGQHYEWIGTEWIIIQEEKDAANSSLIKAKRNRLALCALDSKDKYEREQASILKGISILEPMPESDYVLVLQYLQDLFELPQQSGFPWDGPEDQLCPWPIKPDCVCDTSIS